MYFVLVGKASKKNKNSYSEIGTTIGTRTHEKVGEKFLQNLGFPESVTGFVRGHVDAKRYLVYR